MHPLIHLPLLAVVIIVCACSPQSRADTSSVDLAQRSVGPKRITGAITSKEPTMLRSSAGGNLGGSNAGIDVLEDLLNAGATRRDDTDTLRPLLAEALPSVENGLWKVSSDGRMEMTWNLKEGARWQDGVPVTAQDLVFTLTLCKDNDMLGFCRHVGFAFIDGARASSDRAVTVTWKQPYIEADSLFATQFGMPMPQHLLERTYLENKRSFADLSYWTKEFVGAGPFQIRDWVESSHMVLQANDGYILGRPKIDEIVVKFISDPNALVANILAGEIDANFGRGLSLEQAIQIRDKVPGLSLNVGLPGNFVVAWPQFIDPRPAVILDARFRKALMHAIDRQQMADTLQDGLAPVAHSYMHTDQPRYGELDPLVVKYEFDPRKTVELVQSLGYSRGADGFFRDSAGQRLSVEIRGTGSEEMQTKAQFAVADFWQRAGIGAEPIIITTARLNDHEYRATRPGFEVSQIPDGLKGLRRADSAETPLPENDYGRTSNTSRYMNPEFDLLLTRFFSSIPSAARMQALGQVLHHTSDLVTFLPLFYATESTIVSARMRNVTARKSQEGTMGWNAHEWELS